ncbi:sensor histidine kinase [Sporolactobacillus vineae]|uniref:sensor histidine kinase n=1 Tax=Sporolactobacillus vineae TaxID=444463 RepID=UPI00028919C2|nr:GHKL domain-containing protein [Sporolactobacillus vineae]
MLINPFELFVLDAVNMLIILGAQDYLYGIAKSEKRILLKILTCLLALFGMVFSDGLGWIIFFLGVFVLFFKSNDRQRYFLNIVLLVINNVIASNLSAGIIIRLFQITPQNSLRTYTWTVLGVRVLTLVLIFTVITLLIKWLISSRFFQALLNDPNSRFAVQAIALTCLLIQIIDLAAKHYGVLVAYLGLTVMLFILLAVFSVAILYFYFRTRRKEQDIRLEIEQKRIYERYLKDLEENFNLLRSFKHDYQNLLLSMEMYIEEKDLDGLQRYFNELKISSNRELNQIPEYYKALTAVSDKAVKGILLAKIVKANDSGAAVSLEVTGTPSFPEKDYEMVRILGILLDNAIEASMQSDKPIIRVAIIAKKDDVELSIANSYRRDGEIEINRIFQRGYTTKKDNSGIGLYTVKQIIDHHPDMFLEAEKDPALFKITVAISG